MNADGSNQARLTFSPGFYSQPSWSPDGTKIVFERDGEIYSMNADGSGQTNLTNNPASDSGAVWSPNGKKIAFASTRNSVSGIFVMNADGTNQTRITSNNDFYPDWSPDGTKIAFETARNITTLGYEIYVMNPDGTGQKDITNNPSFLDIRPSWSPDGTKIAFHSTRAGFHAIFVMNADGRDPKQVADFGTIDAAPSWSPDGTKIIYDSNPGDPDFGNEEIVMVNSDGSGNRTNLTNNPASDVEPDWGVQTATRQLTITSSDLSGNPVSGVWTVIRSSGGTVLKTGFTPFTFTGNSGTVYQVSVANYDGKIFNRWQDDGNTNNSRTITLSSDSNVNAIYDTGDSLRGFTPLTYNGTVEIPRGIYSQDLTVNATTLDGSKVLHMWTIIDPQSTDAQNRTFKIYAGNYQNLIFDHWSDGSTDRVKSITIDGNTTMTAYYRTG